VVLRGVDRVVGPGRLSPALNRFAPQPIRPVGALKDAHVALAWVMIVANALAGGWALAAHRWESLRTPALWWFTGVAQVLVVVQVIVGVALVNVEDVEAPQFHMLYGFSAVIAVAIVYSYRHLAGKLYLLYGFGGLFIMGLGIRELFIGGTR